jgi:hypothetical protein
MIFKSPSSSRVTWGMCSLGKRLRSLVRRNRLRSRVERNQVSSPTPSLNLSPCDFIARDGHKGEFCFKKKREERMAKEWANKDKYHPSNGVPQPHMQMPRAKAIVRTIPAWGDRKVAVVLLAELHRSDRCATPVRLVQV